MKEDIENIEKIALGTLITYPKTYFEIANRINENSFEGYPNKCVFKGIVSRVVKGDLDVITLEDELRTMNLLDKVGGDVYLLDLAACGANPWNLESYISILEKQRKRKSVGDLVLETNDMLYKHDDPDKILSNLNDSITKILSNGEKSGENLAYIVDTFKDSMNVSLKETLIQSGFKDLDSFMGGFERSDLIILAGATSMGKTSFALNLAKNILLNKHIIALFSLEMTSQQLISRLISVDARVPLKKIRYKTFSDFELERIQNSMDKLRSLNMIIDDNSTTMNQIANQLRHYKLKYKIDVAFVDYLQLVSNSSSGTREQEVAKVVRTLKNLAKELNICIFALSQLSRKVDAREDNKKPRLSDLRESGEIEQAADLVLFLYRPDYYSLEPQSSEDVQSTEVIIAKGRNTGIGNIGMKFIPEYTMFLDNEETISTN